MAGLGDVNRTSWRPHKNQELLYKVGYAVAQLVVALRYQPEYRGFDSQWCQGEYFIYLVLPVALWPWG
jgi:hypothetical protein